MGVRVLAATAVFVGILSASASGFAYNQKIIVYASVAPQRAVYVNEGGFITKVAGNTSENIEPRIIGENNQTLTMTEAIRLQYQAFLNLHHGRLQASKEYKVNPVWVDTTPNTQKILVDTKLTLGSD